LCEAQEAIDQSPMLRVRQPRTTQRLIPIILDTCRRPDFIQVRDEAIIRVLYNTGARLSEVAGLGLEDVDLDLDVVRFHGKGAKDRRVRIGPKTARALSRYRRSAVVTRASGCLSCGWPCVARSR
jgi:integrase/recombinase XerC